MLKGCLIAAAFAVALAVGTGVYLWTKKDAIVTGIQEVFEVPPHGTSEHIEPLYGDLFKELDAVADKTDSRFTFGAAVEKMELPKEVVYIGIKQGNSTTDVIKTTDWNSHTFKTVNGYGAGSVSAGGETIQLMIRDRSGSWDYMDGYVVYLEYKEAEPAESPEEKTNAAQQDSGN
jgi:hypothetical protein